MEIIILFLGLAFLFWTLSDTGNFRPVSDWSDEKLQRMHKKLLKAAHTSRNVGNHDASKKYSDRAKEVLDEIGKRVNKRTPENSMNGAIAALSSKESRDIAKEYAEKTLAILEETMQEFNVGIEDAHAIISKKINELEAKHRANGLDSDDATEAAIRDLFSQHKKSSEHKDSEIKPYLLNKSIKQRTSKDIMDEFNISQTDFDRLYFSYKFSLQTLGENGNWNEDIDNHSILNGALSTDEIETARTSIERAILNRIIVRYVTEINNKASNSSLIYGSGDALSRENPLIINSPNMSAGIAAEYNWLTKKFGAPESDWVIADRQHGITDNGKAIEAFFIRTRNNEDVVVYFDITSFYMGGIPSKNK